MERPPLTARQQEIFEFIRDSLQAGCSPTMREIMLHFGMASTNSVECHLKSLTSKGYIVRDHLKSRGIRLTGKTLREAVGELLAVEPVSQNPPFVVRAKFSAALAEVRRIYRGSA